jgi:ubiquitin-like protein 4
MATEVTFAKTFLSLLDSKPPKISPDHVEDARNYPGSSPVCLPPSLFYLPLLILPPTPSIHTHTHT